MIKKIFGIIVLMLLSVTVLTTIETAEEDLHTEEKIKSIIFSELIDDGHLCECEDNLTSTNNNSNNLNTKKIDNKDTEKDLLEIRKAIERQNANWTVNNTYFLNSTLLLQNEWLGCIDEEFDENQYETIFYEGPLPDGFDWQNVNGTNWITPIKSQSSCGSCTAFGTVGALEAVVQIEIGKVFDCDLSEAHLFFCGGGTCNGGMSLSDAANYVKKFGVPDELCFPYAPSDMPCGETNPDWKQRVVKASKGAIGGKTQIKNALVQYGPVLASFTVYEDFQYYNGGIYEHVWGNIEAGHAIAIVGYNDNPGYWICKNSWGSGWGENGFFRIKYGECGIDKTAYYFHDVSGNIQPFNPDLPSPNNGQENVDPDINLSWNSCEDPDGDDVYYNVYLTESFSVGFDDIIAEHISTNFFHIDNLEKGNYFSWFVIAEDEYGSQRQSDTWKFATRAPYAAKIEGKTQVKVGIEYTYTASTIDTDGQEYYWYFDWGDDTNSGWIGPYSAGQEVYASHSWSKKSDFTLEVRYKEDGKMSDWSTLEVGMPKNKSINIPFLNFLENYLHLFPLIRNLLQL